MLSILQSEVSSESRRPHVLFVVVDDLGWNDVGFRSHVIKTPTIDKLASEGIILDQYYVQEVCSPSRAAFMTGRYPLHNTVRNWLKTEHPVGLPLNETLMPQHFKNSGYATHAIGKWHLGFYTWEHTPTFRGFDSFYGFYSGGEDYNNHYVGEFLGYDMRNDSQPRCGGNCSQVAYEAQGHYSTHVFTNQAISVINSHDGDSPLFLYLAYQAVHTPAQVPSSYSDKYADSIPDHKRRIFAGMLSCVDEGLHNITTALEAKGMMDDLIVVFTTDNGGPISTIVGGDAIGSSNYPLKGGKHSSWEGGTRGTAFIWASENIMPDERRGSSFSGLMHGVDWLPTFCEAATLNCSAKYNLSTGAVIDGISQWNAMLDPSVGQKREEFLYGEHDGGNQKDSDYDLALRLGDWKLFQGWGGKPTFYSGINYTFPNGTLDPFGDSMAENLDTSNSKLLFNVIDDPLETTDLSADHKYVVEIMSMILDQYRGSAVDVVGGGTHPDPNCPPFQFQKDDEVGTVLAPWC